ncbi:MAG: hypothetical protein NC243_11990, partial [Lachnoclostridium sp.]|nr:hypothetical protein [Lachnoclostridium sp.]
QIDQYNAAAMESMGTVAQADGTVKGKVITSMASGSESVGYSTGGNFDKTDVMKAAGDREYKENVEYRIAKENIGGVPDANGVNLLFSGEYPRKREVW